MKFGRFSGPSSPLRSIRARMTLALAGAVALVILLAGALFLGAQSRASERRHANALRRVEIEVRGAKTTEEITRKLDDWNEGAEFAFEPPIAAWLLKNNANDVQNEPEITWRYRPMRRFRRDEPPPFRADSPPFRGDRPRPDRARDRERRRRGTPFSEPQNWRTVALDWNGQTLLLGAPFRRSADALRTTFLAILGIGFLTTLAAAAGAYALVGKTLAPIDELAQQTRDAAQNPAKLMALSAQNAPFQPTSSDVEMVRLVATFNQFLAQMRENVLSKERFHAAASHELRTPLQALGGHLQLALSRERDAQSYREALEEAAKQTERLSRLTQDLLLLNRLQTAASAPTREKIDVGEIGDLTLQRAEKIIAARGLKLRENLETFEAEGVHSHLEILMRNLVENAAKYAKTGGEIGVETDAAQREVTIWNECDAPTLAALEGQIERLDEAFFRPDAARHSSTGGNGLGLAICRAVAEANDWKFAVTLENERFVARLRF